MQGNGLQIPAHSLAGGLSELRDRMPALFKKTADLKDQTFLHAQETSLSPHRGHLSM